MLLLILELKYNLSSSPESAIKAKKSLSVEWFVPAPNGHWFDVRPDLFIQKEIVNVFLFDAVNVFVKYVIAIN